MILTLVRHGETDQNKDQIIQGRIDNPLNKTGKKQAQAFFIDKKYDEIGSSGLSRAIETAEIIKKNLNHDKSILIIPEFVERAFGELDNAPFEIAHPIITTNPNNIIGYESDEEIVSRILNATFKLYEQYKDKNIMIVAHSHSIKALLYHIDPIKYSFAYYRFKNLEYFSFKVSKNKITLIA